MATDAPKPSKHYRLYVTNGRGRIDAVAEEIHAASDEEAFAEALARFGEAGFELWDGGRRVVTAGHGERDADRPGDQGWARPK